MDAQDAGLSEAYNNAVLVLKEFRDAHMIIAALYILGPARRAKAAALGRDVSFGNAMESDGVKGTGGTDVVKFLKDIRNRTANTVTQLNARSLVDDIWVVLMDIVNSRKLD